MKSSSYLPISDADFSAPAKPAGPPKAWRHQVAALQFARPLRGAMLAMAMGTGKSKVAIDLILARRHKRVLILCPLSVVGVWPDEFARHAGGAVSVCSLGHASVKQKKEKMCSAISLADVRGTPVAVICNYEAAWREPFGTHAMTRGFDLLILDESHRIKAPGGRASRYVFRLSKLIRSRLALTGTPMPHSFLDIYAQYRAVDPTVFGTNFNRFKHTYGIYGGYGGYELRGIQNKAELNRKIYSIAYRVSKHVLDLPEEMHITRVARLAEQGQKVYADLEKRFVSEVAEGTITVYNALTKLLRLQQLTSGFIRTDNDEIVAVDNEKLKLMAETVEDTDPAEPWVIFCRFRRDLEAVHLMSQSLGRSCLELSGTRNELRRWQKGEAAILATQISAGGVGIDLTRACYCGYYSLGFSLGDYEQSLARVHRPGQLRSVTYYHWIIAGTIDERVMRALDARADVVEDILKNLKEKPKPANQSNHQELHQWTTDS